MHLKFSENAKNYKAVLILSKAEISHKQKFEYKNFYAKIAILIRIKLFAKLTCLNCCKFFKTVIKKMFFYKLYIKRSGRYHVCYNLLK